MGDDADRLGAALQRDPNADDDFGVALTGYTSDVEQTDTSPRTLGGDTGPTHRRRQHRRRAALAVAAALVSAPLLAVPAAAGSDIDGGLWYYSATGLEEVHQTITGEGVQIALIDGLVNPGAPELAGTNLTVREPAYCAAEEGGPAIPATSTVPGARHTTSMASILIGNGTGLGGERSVRGVAPGAAVTVYATTGTDPETCPAVVGSTGYAQAFADAVSEGADIIVVPGAMRMSVDDYTAAVQAGVVVIGAGGNDGLAVTGWPATLNGAVATGTVGPGTVLDPGSSTGDHLGVVAPGADFRSIDPTFTTYGLSTGSSNSSVYTAGALALLMSAHPDATSNQILQALVRTTDGTEHEPRWDEDHGFGSVHVRQLVSSDPSTYPDENPFISDDADQTPSAESLLATTPDPSSSADPTGTAEDLGSSSDASLVGEDGGAGIGTTGIVIATIAVLAALTAATAALVLARRRRARSSTTGAF